MTQCYDLIIAGNGILANAVAFELARRVPRLRVALIGPKTRPGCASWAAGAMLNVFGEIEAGSLDHPLQRYKFGLARNALALWPAWHEALAAAAGAAGEPGVSLGTTILRPHGEAANYAAICAALDEAGEPFTVIDPRGIEGYRPGGAPATEAIHIPREGRVDPRRLFVLFDRIFPAHETITAIDETLVEIGIGRDGVKSAHLAGGATVTAQKLLIAAGAESSRLIAGLPDLHARIQPVRYGIGAALLFKTRGAMPPHVLRADYPAFDHGIHLVPHAHGEIYVGASNDVAEQPDYEPRPDRVRLLKEAAAAYFDEDLAKLEPRVLLGFRPWTQDGFPLIGETSIEGLFLLTGTRRDGLHCSPLYAQDMADRILGGQGFIAGFEPERSAATKPA